MTKMGHSHLFFASHLKRQQKTSQVPLKKQVEHFLSDILL